MVILSTGSDLGYILGNEIAAHKTFDCGFI